MQNSRQNKYHKEQQFDTPQDRGKSYHRRQKNQQEQPQNQNSNQRNDYRRRNRGQTQGHGQQIESHQEGGQQSNMREVVQQQQQQQSMDCMSSFWEIYQNIRGVFNSEIFRRLGVQPTSQQFFSAFARSFIHKSFSQNHCYEKSEYLGDSVVNFIIKNYLSQRYILCSIDEINQLYMILISRQYFSLFSEKLGLNRFMLNKKSELSMNHKTQLQKDQCDVFESFCHGLLTYCGFDKLQQFMVYVLEEYVDFKELVDKFMIHEDVVRNIELKTLQGKKKFNDIFKVMRYKIENENIQKIPSEDERDPEDIIEGEQHQQVKKGKIKEQVTYCYVLKDVQTKQMYLQMCHTTKIALKRAFYGKIYEIMKKSQFCYDEVIVHLANEKVNIALE